MLEGEVREQVMIEDLRVLLMGIMRITDHKRIGVERPEVDERLEQKRMTSDSNYEEPDYGVGFFNDKNLFCIPPEDLPVINRHFHLLYLNRI